MAVLSDQWQDYEIIDAGDGEKLERWGKVILRRPDPQCIWPRDRSERRWERADGHYHRSGRGGGSWEYARKLPESWTVGYHGLTFKVAPTGFKHTGLFPEQAANWDWIAQRIAGAQAPVKVLNLFAYTGAASLAAAKGGAAEVVHVDAAKGMVAWAKENQELSGLGSSKIRFIVDDVNKFVAREARRGRAYQAIIMDPPAYGRGPDGEMWKLEDQLPGLIDACLQILSPDPLFFIVNSYAAGLAPGALENLLRLTLGRKYPGRKVTVAELALPISHDGLALPAGFTGRFE